MGQITTSVRGNDMWRRAVDTWASALNTWAGWLKAGGARPRTIKLWRYYVCRLAEDHLHTSPWRLSEDDLTNWLAGNSSWGPDARKNARSAVRSFYRWAHSTRKIKADPARDLPSVKVPQPRDPGKPQTGYRKAICGCGRVIRVAASTLEDAEITCGKCGESFELAA